MRLVLQALAMLIAGLIFNAPSVYAYTDSFFSKRYCTMLGSSHDGGSFADCSFNTWEQCLASASGLGHYCTENPFWKPEASGGKERTKQHKTKHKG